MDYNLRTQLLDLLAYANNNQYQDAFNYMSRLLDATALQEQRNVLISTVAGLFGDSPANLIAGVKQYRSVTGETLQNSKLAVETIRDEIRDKASRIS